MIEYYLARGLGYFLFIFFIFVGIYFIWKIIGKLLENYFFEKDKMIVTKSKKQIISITIGVLLIILLSSIYIVLSFKIMSPNIDEHVISRNNNYLMEIDHSIFGVYPTIWLQQSNNELKPIIDMIVPFLIKIYFSLTLIINIMLFTLFIVKTRLCIHFICAFFLCPIFSMPFWYLFPATSPVIAYWEPILFHEISTNIEVALSTYSPIFELEDIMQYVVNFRISERDTALFVTTIPSIHIAWGFLLAYYLTKLSKILIFVAIPLFIANSISTIITMQHYAIDTVAGVLIAILAIYVTKLILNRYIYIFNPIVDLVEVDVKSVGKWLKGRNKT